MAIKLFVTDMDGTLLNSRHEISIENKKAIREAAAQGVIVTIATGRMYASAHRYAQELGVDVPIITYNGALIRPVTGEDVFSSCLDEKVVEDVLRYCFERNWYVQIYNNTADSDNLYFEQACTYSHAYEASVSTKGQVIGRAGMLKKCAHVPKVLVITSGLRETESVLAELREKFGSRIFPVKSNANYVEIINENVNKGSAILQLAKMLGIQPHEIMAIGDSDNDLPMLRMAGQSVAMGNAGENIKCVCNYITADCDTNGVAQAIREHVLK